MAVQQQPQQDQTRSQRNEMPQAPRKTFVEPVISSPVDVLEATTFFQTVDSGGTGLRRKPE